MDVTRAYQEAEKARALFEYMEALVENLQEWQDQAEDLDFPGIGNSHEKHFFQAMTKLIEASESIYEKSKSLAASADDDFG